MNDWLGRVLEAKPPPESVSARFPFLRRSSCWESFARRLAIGRSVGAVSEAADLSAPWRLPSSETLGGQRSRFRCGREDFAMLVVAARRSILEEV
jgi:hypothetical protein